MEKFQESYKLSLSELELLRSFVCKDIFDFICSADSHSEYESPIQAPPNDMFLHPSASATNLDPYPILESDPLEAELDSLLLACSQQYDNQQEFMQDAKRPRLDMSSSSTQSLVPTTSSGACTKSKNLRSFAPPKSEDDIAKAKRNAIPNKTHEDTRYCISIWNDWCKHCSVDLGEAISPIEDLSIDELANLLRRFIFEVRKQDGSEFPPNSLHHIVSGIQRYIQWNGKPAIDLFKDGEFAEFCVCLDSEMKRLQKSGLGSHKKKAEPLTIEEEELLW